MVICFGIWLGFFKFKKWHFKSRVSCSVLFRTSISLPKQLILGALIITLCKKTSQSISAATWLVLLTFLSCNSCSCYLFYDCLKHSIKHDTKNMAKNVFKTEIKCISCFLCFSFGFEFLTRSFFPPSSPTVCVWAGFISDVPIVQKLDKAMIRFGQNFPGKLKRRAVCLCEAFQAICFDAVFFFWYLRGKGIILSWERLEGLSAQILCIGTN